MGGVLRCQAKALSAKTITTKFWRLKPRRPCTSHCSRNNQPHNRQCLIPAPTVSSSSLPLPIGTSTVLSPLPADAMTMDSRRWLLLAFGGNDPLLVRPRATGQVWRPACTQVWCKSQIRTKVAIWAFSLWEGPYLLHTYVKGGWGPCAQHAQHPGNSLRSISKLQALRERGCAKVAGTVRYFKNRDTCKCRYLTVLRILLKVQSCSR